VKGEVEIDDGEIDELGLIFRKGIGFQ